MEKYNIEEFYFVEEELLEYYKTRDIYLEDNNLHNEVSLRNALESLFFALKGYTALGYITQYKFDEMIEQFEEEVNES